MSKGRWTEAMASLRATDDPLTFEGTAVPYGVATVNPVAEYGMREAFAPHAFAGSVEHWMTRDDGGRMAFRARHGQDDIGTIVSLRDEDAGLAFTLKLDDEPAGQSYAKKVRAGRNGVSVEFVPEESKSAKLRDGTILHREARLYAIAGSVSPAYDGARLSLRDMEEPMAENETPLPPDPPPPVPEPEPQPTAAKVEREAVAAFTRDGGVRGSITITRSQAVYGRDATPLADGTKPSFLRDGWLSTNIQGRPADPAAQERQFRHYQMLQDASVAMEKSGRTYADIESSQRAGDVLSSEVPGAYPNDYLPGLFTPRIFKGRPMGSFYDRFPISDALPKIFAKVSTSTTVAVQGAEGTNPAASDFATTAVTATPLLYGAETVVSRQVLDGASPAAETMIMQDMMEAYAQASETVIKTAVEAGSTASGVTLLIATPYAGTLANTINYYAVRFRAAQAVFIPSAAYPVLLAQPDTTGRPFVPMIGAINTDATVETGASGTRILGADGRLSYASTVNVWVFAASNDFVIFESPVARFSYDAVTGPAGVRIGIWAYLVVGARLGSLKITAT